MYNVAKHSTITHTIPNLYNNLFRYTVKCIMAHADNRIKQHKTGKQCEKIRKMVVTQK